jgi:hypothetical protein
MRRIPGGFCRPSYTERCGQHDQNQIIPFCVSKFSAYKNNYYKAVARGDEKAAINGKNDNAPHGKKAA